MENLLKSILAVSQAVSSWTRKMPFNVSALDQSFILVCVNILSYTIWDYIHHVCQQQNWKEVVTHNSKNPGQTLLFFFHMVPGKYSYRYFQERNNYLCSDLKTNNHPPPLRKSQVTELEKKNFLLDLYSYTQNMNLLMTKKHMQNYTQRLTELINQIVEHILFKANTTFNE